MSSNKKKLAKALFASTFVVAMGTLAVWNAQDAAHGEMVNDHSMTDYLESRDITDLHEALRFYANKHPNWRIKRYGVTSPWSEFPDAAKMFPSGIPSGNHTKVSSWKYQISAAAAGHTWSELGEEDVLIDVVPSKGTRAFVLGIKKSIEEVHKGRNH